MAEKSVLVIDDEAAIVNVIKLHLEKNGYKVFTACDGVQGLSAAYEHKPGLIILDVNMPKKGGLEFFNDILVGNNKKMFPVLVLTGRHEFEGLFKNMNADGFIPKPIDFTKLLDEVERIFKQANKGKAKAKNILIVEDNDAALDHLLLPFIRAGFRVQCIKSYLELSGDTAIDRPDLVLVKLALCDNVPELRRASDFMKSDTTVLLYASPELDMNKDAVKGLCQKAGVTGKELIRTENPAELLLAVKEVLEKKNEAV